MIPIIVVAFVERNSPVESEKVLNTQADINNAIHFGYNNNLTTKTKEEIVRLLGGEAGSA